MFKVGTVCVKIAGRDAGKSCAIVEELGNGFVLVDGGVRRRKVNIKHLEPMGSVDLKKGASHETVVAALGLEPRKSAKRERKPKPSAIRKVKPAADAAPKKKAAKKAS